MKALKFSECKPCSLMLLSAACYRDTICTHVTDLRTLLEKHSPFVVMSRLSLHVYLAFIMFKSHTIAGSAPPLILFLLFDTKLE